MVLVIPHMKLIQNTLLETVASSQEEIKTQVVWNVLRDFVAKILNGSARMADPMEESL